MKLKLSGPSFRTPSSDSERSQTLNMYYLRPEKEEDSGALIPSPGLSLIQDLGGTEIRGMITVNGTTYIVQNANVWSCVINPLTLSYTTTFLGTIFTSTGTVRFAYNQTQLVFVDGSVHGYYVTLATNVLAAIADVNFLGGTHVVCCDNYFVYNEVGTQTIRCSALNDGTTWPALSFAQAGKKPDIIKGLVVSKGEIWVFGEYSVEVWYDAANALGIPFSPRVGAELDVGTTAPGSIVSINNFLVWMDNRGLILKSQIAPYVRNNSTGSDARTLSDDFVNGEIASYTTTSDAIGLTYSDRGHLMYQLTFPSERKTLVCDLTEEAEYAPGRRPPVWTEKSYYDSFTDSHIAHLATYSTLVGNVWVVGGTTSGKIYAMSTKYYSDNGTPIHRIRRTPILRQEGKIITIDKLQLRVTSGLAPSTGSGSDPQIVLRYSHDGGHTWSDGLTRDLGKIGNYNNPIIWNRLGDGTEWMFEFTVTEPINFSFVDGYIDISSIEDAQESQ